jgi:dihydroxyacetone kinase-like protein
VKKLINSPAAAVEEMIEGFVGAHADLLRLAAPRVVVRRKPARNKVGIIIGGGSGHEPAFLGYVGAGMADAAVIGDVFTSPTPDAVLEAMRLCEMGRGVVLSYGNYAGDVMNFGMAAEIAAGEGMEVRQVLVADDVASAPPHERERRRGIAGDIFVFKALGAMAEQGASLDEVARVGRATNEVTRSMGVALGPCEVPGVGRPTFELPPDAMEIGLGVHGEPGVRRGPLLPADEVAHLLVTAILEDYTATGNRPGEIALMVNGLGATAYLDLHILYRAARRELEAAGCRVARSFVGEYITSLEMAGASLTVSLLEDELRGLLDAPAWTPALVMSTAALGD